VVELASGWEAFAFGLIFLCAAAFAAERLRSPAPRRRPFGLPCAARSGRDRPKTRPLRGLRQPRSGPSTIDSSVDTLH
jgi:hypothetical protein